LKTPSITWVPEAAPVVDFAPASIAKRELAAWGGLQVETLQITRREPFEHRFHGRRHLLFAAERASHYGGETYVEGSPGSRLRELSGKLTFVPAGHRFYGWYHPRVLTQLVYVYIDPTNLFVPCGARFNDYQIQAAIICS
jgi:AraC family transcriptional regulator